MASAIERRNNFLDKTEETIIHLKVLDVQLDDIPLVRPHYKRERAIRGEIDRIRLILEPNNITHDFLDAVSKNINAVKIAVDRPAAEITYDSPYLAKPVEEEMPDKKTAKKHSRSESRRSQGLSSHVSQ